MEPAANNTPLIVIVGETASGKSALAMQIAERFNGEITCADSRTIYKGMDIGTAKPSAEDRAHVPHHLLDIVAPDQSFTAFEFKERANAAIADITSRCKTPLLVGGSGLYIDAVLYDFQFRAPADLAQRERLQTMSVEELQNALHEAGLPLPTNERNPRHLIRVLETNGEQVVRGELRPNTLVIGLQNDPENLRVRITARVDAMVEAGFVSEVRQLFERYGADAPGLQSPGYTVFREYLEGKLSLEEAKRQLVREHLQLAKRQRTWFKRNKSIHWTCKQAEAIELITTSLNK